MALFDFPRWQLTSPSAASGVVAPDERLSVGQTMVMGVQHAVAMFGATVLMPILMGLDPNLAILLSGIGTLLFFLVTGGRVPSYLGSSAAFIGVVIAVTGFNGQGLNPHLSVALGGIIACGLVYTLIGVVVMKIGTRWIERLMPPVVTGAVVMAIGLNLAPIAVHSVSASAFDGWMAVLTVLCIGLVAVFTRGMIQRLLILVGLIVACGLYALLANLLGLGKPLDFTLLHQAAWFGLPHFTAPTFDGQAMMLIAPVAVILVAENLGHLKAVAGMTGRNSGPLYGTGVRRRRAGDDALRRGGRQRRDHLCGKYRRDGGDQSLFHPGVCCRRADCHFTRLFTEVWRVDPYDPRAGYRRRVDRGLWLDCGRRRPYLGTESG
ncbi:Putative pyrimidine permease RutG [Raoultella planticola]|uniref:Pyrimidine permease RutG n=1 Tax=Raoultella planticola TaxID=575 RepID=A0A485AJA0_RAOPL|nr:Putative pyrimidine permease RutG [Raoultella planticola]